MSGCKHKVTGLFLLHFFVLITSQIKCTNTLNCPYATYLSGKKHSGPLQTTSFIDSVAPDYSNIISKYLNLNDDDWAHVYYNDKNSEHLQCLIPPKSCNNDTKNLYYRTFDGSCNNYQYPGFGIARSRYSRILAPQYGDGKYAPSLSSMGKPLPSARLLSLSLFGEDANTDKFRTVASMQWGQIVAHDISELTTNGAPTDCCAEVSNKLCYPIYLHAYGPIMQSTGRTCVNFARAISDADALCPPSGYPFSEKISVVNAYLDLSSIYGNSLEQNKKIRVYKKGLLKVSHINNRNWLPILHSSNGECGGHRNKCYSIPDMRNQFIPTIAVFHTLFQREHNRIAGILSRINPHFSDEQIFEEARKINIAQYQKITYNDWLPVVLGTSYVYENQLAYYNVTEYVYDYDPRVNAAPFAEYAAAAFRYNHNQIPGFIALIGANNCENKTLRLSDFFDRDETIDFIAYKENFDSLIRGLASQLHKRSDNHIDKEIKHFFDRKPFEMFGSDLKAIDIQRGRDFGLPSYNQVRKYCGLKPAVTWSDFSDRISAEKISLMQKIYTYPDDVELAVGGALENNLPESVYGITFQCIITKQFLKTRTGDRFFFENGDAYTGFKPDQLIEIRKASLASLICNNADYLQYVQENVFVKPNMNNPVQHCLSIPKMDLTKWKY